MLMNYCATTTEETKVKEFPLTNLRELFTHNEAKKTKQWLPYSYNQLDIGSMLENSSNTSRGKPFCQVKSLHLVLL